MPCRRTCACTAVSGDRLTRNRVSSSSSAYVAAADTTSTSPYRRVDCCEDTTAGSSTSPRACRAVNANGSKIACRHAGPPGSVRIGAITLTSWAWHATDTRSAWLSSVISRSPTTTASTAV